MIGPPDSSRRRGGRSVRRFAAPWALSLVLHAALLTIATAVLTSAPRPEAPAEVVFTLDLRPMLARARDVEPPLQSPSSLRQEIPPQTEPPELAFGLPASEELVLDEDVRLAPHTEATSMRRSGALSTAIGASAVASGRFARGSRVGLGSPDGVAASAGPAVAVAVEPIVTDEPPVALETPQPAYPDSARRRGAEGVVLCRLLVTEAGSVGDVEITSSSGNPVLDEAAREGLKRWKFRPATHGGQAYSCTLEQRITFQLH